MGPYTIEHETAYDLDARARRVREGLGALARRYMFDSYGFVQAARLYLQLHEPALAETIRLGQLRAFFKAAQTTLYGAPGVIAGPPTPGAAAHEIAPLAQYQQSHTMLPTIEHGAAWLRNRIRFTPAEFDRLDADARSLGFTVARQHSQETVDRLGRSLAQAVESGAHFKNWLKVTREAVDVSLTNPQLETIFRTWTGKAYAAGQKRVLDDPGVLDEFPYILYSAIHDSRVRPEHLQMEKNGLYNTSGRRTAVYRYDDPIWREFWPPWAWNCRCAVTPLSLEDAAEKYHVAEAVRWLRSGTPPAEPEHVPPPDFGPPDGFVLPGHTF